MTMNILQSIFREVFDDSDLVIDNETTANDVEGWDSLSNVNLILAIETRFNVKFSAKELREFKKAGDMLLSIEKKLQVAVQGS